MERKRIGGGLLVLAGAALAQEMIVRLFDWAWKLLVGDGPATSIALINIVGLAGIVMGLYLVFSPSAQKVDKLAQVIKQLDSTNTSLDLVTSGARKPN